MPSQWEVALSLARMGCTSCWVTGLQTPLLCKLEKWSYDQKINMRKNPCISANLICLANMGTWVQAKKQSKDWSTIVSWSLFWLSTGRNEINKWLKNYAAKMKTLSSFNSSREKMLNQADFHTRRCNPRFNHKNLKVRKWHNFHKQQLQLYGQRENFPRL